MTVSIRLRTHTWQHTCGCHGGKAKPSADDVKQILRSVGVDDDEEQLQVVNDSFAQEDVSGAELPARVRSGGTTTRGAAAAAADAPAGETREEEENTSKKRPSLSLQWESKESPS